MAWEQGSKSDSFLLCLRGPLDVAMISGKYRQIASSSKMAWGF